MKGTWSAVRRFLVKRRGDCLGALGAGLFFIYVAPRTEIPEAFIVLGTPLAVGGAALSVFAVFHSINEGAAR